MNWIRQHILVELAKHSRRRYSELRPDGVEGNLFLYHLDGLIKEKLVEKVARSYQLTLKGLRQIATLSLATGRQRQQPQLLTAVICRNDQDEYLLARWRREPNAGLISLPHGMVHYGRSLSEMAATELAEKAGLEARLTYKGRVGVRAYYGTEIDRHMIVELYEAGEVASGRGNELRPEMAEVFWARPETLDPAGFVPGFYEILRLVGATEGGMVFEDITVSREAI